jgi:hypothetical protein
LNPPPFFWGPPAEKRENPDPGATPELGKAWYTGWRGPTAGVRELIHDVETKAIDWPVITRQFYRCCEMWALKERVWAVKHGHTAVTLSQLHQVLGMTPPAGEKCIVLRGLVEITPEVAAETLASAT